MIKSPGYCRGLKITSKLGTKIAVLLWLIICGVTLVSGYFFYQISSQVVKDSTKCRLRALALEGAAKFNAKELEQLQSEANEHGEIYLRLQKKLQFFLKSNRDLLKFVYVIGRKGQAYFYLLDAIPVGDDEHSSLGQKFDVAVFPEARSGFSKPTAESKPTYDSEYRIYSQSGYAPIVDASGKTVAVLGIDMALPKAMENQMELLRASGFVLGAALILALVIGIVFSLYIIEPVHRLMEGFTRVAEGDFSREVCIKRRDEFGMLATSFNQMSVDLKQLHNRLFYYNQLLEEEIQRQMIKLSAVNQEMQDMLDNISLGICTFDRNYKINCQYSKNLETIFAKTSLGDTNFCRLLYPAPQQIEERENLELWLQLLFMPHEMKLDELMLMQPVQELEARMADGCTKYLRINLLPMKLTKTQGMEIEDVVKIMAIVEDISKTRNLEKEIEERDSVGVKDSVEQISTILESDLELSRQFVIESNDELAEMELDLMRYSEKGNNDVLPAMFRMAHTIKGNAANLGLKHISNTAHKLEDLFEQLRTGSTVKVKEWANQVYKKVDLLKEQLTDVEDLFWKIVDSQQKDMGQTRTEHRIREGSMLLKVNASDFKEIEAMIDQIKGMVGTQLENPELGILFDATEKQLRKLQMVRVGRIFSRFRKMVRDLSEALGKQVELQMSGENIWVEKYVFDWLGDPLIHLLRNAIDHGIELPQQRLNAGKSAVGTIWLHVAQNEHELWVEITDDGQGIDVTALGKKALEKQLVSQEQLEGMSEAAQLQLIFYPGFSTSETVTEISGRGVGMDVVRTMIEEKLQGRIILDTKVNEGLKVILQIPLHQE